MNVQRFIVICKTCGHTAVEEKKSFPLLEAQLSYQTTCPRGHEALPSRWSTSRVLSASGLTLKE